MGWLDHKELKLICGVNAVPGDQNTVESPPIVVNLLDSSAGIALQGQDGWSPKVPGIEGSGIWSDSPLSPGRTLISAVEGNVTETMRLVITGSSLLGMIKTLNSLYAMADNARKFWTDSSQIQPVYLHWWASCGAGRQYAQIFNITIEPTFLDSPNTAINATITIEREPYWRGIPPGANPKQWSLEYNSQPYSSLRDGSLETAPFLFNATGNNRSEFSKSGSTFTLISDNSVTIPANLIPGDAPALVLFKAGVSPGTFQVIIGKKTTKIVQYSSGVSPPVIVLPQNLTFNATDGVAGTDATKVADTGACKNNVSGTAQRVEVSFATATNQLRWNIFASLAMINRYIGRFMVFMRCRQQGGTVGDITMYLRYAPTVALDTDGVKLNVVSPPVIAGAGNTTNWGLVYMGVIDSPAYAGKANVNTGNSNVANGLQGDDTFTFDLGLFALRSAGVAPLYINDVLLIPIDEGSIMFEKAGTLSGANWYDNTGYFTHGTPDLFGIMNSPASAGTAPTQLTGPGIELTPNVENRLYFISYDSATLFSQIADTIGITLFIVPRWRGIRDRTNLIG